MGNQKNDDEFVQGSRRILRCRGEEHSAWAAILLQGVLTRLPDEPYKTHEDDAWNENPGVQRRLYLLGATKKRYDGPCGGRGQRTNSYRFPCPGLFREIGPYSPEAEHVTDPSVAEQLERCLAMLRVIAAGENEPL